jgi:hypothetical protein
MLRNIVLLPLFTAAVLTILALPPCAFAASPPAGGTFGDTVGVNVKFSQGEPQRDLPLLKDLGVRWVRDNVSWSDVEPVAGQYQEFPAAFQQRLAYYRANNIGVVFLLGYQNSKAYPNSPDKPHNDINSKAFGAFAVAAAKLLKASGVKFVLEIWNEPHNFTIAKEMGGAWNGKPPSPWVDQYVDMVTEAVKQVKGYDPSVKLIDCDDMWIIHYWYLDKGLPRDLDGFGIHPYANDGPEMAAVSDDTDWCKPFQVVDADRSLQSAVRRLSEQAQAKLGKIPEMWATEWGWGIGNKTRFGAVDEKMLAGLLPRTFIVADAAGFKAVCWFSDYDSVDGPMGLRSNDDKKRLTYYAFKTMTQQLGACTMVKQIAGMDHLTSGTQAYLFHGPDGYKVVAWNIDGNAAARLDGTGKLTPKAVDNLGQPVPLAGSSAKLLLGPAPVYISGVTQAVSISPLPAGQIHQISSVVKLDQLTDGETDWTADSGDGADKSLTVLKDTPAPAHSTLQFSATMPGGGKGLAYLIKDLSDLDLSDITAFHFRVKSDNVTNIAVQIKDGTGQTHQIKGVAITADGQWHDLTLAPAKIAGIEHWAGANDGKWHGQPKGIVIILSGQSDTKDLKPVLDFTDITADAVQDAVAQAPAYRSDFAGAKALPQGWSAGPEAQIDTTSSIPGSNSLKLSRANAGSNNQAAIVAIGPVFPVTPGQWQFALDAKSDLNSPDDSFDGVGTIELLDSAGQIIRKVTVTDIYGQHDWATSTKTVDIGLGSGISSARFVVQLNKPSGTFWVDNLSAASMAPAAHKDDRVARLLFSTSRLGNLWYPNDPRKVDVRVESTKPLLDSQRTVSYHVSDYWGAEQTKPATLTVVRNGKNRDRFLYTGSIDLSSVPLENGRYYELHGSVPEINDEPFANFTSFAILPEAATKAYKPEEIPFTSRDWDNRISEYLELTDRLGIRVAGIWGGWSEKPPYAPEAPGLDVVSKLGMGWLTGTPAHSIEAGETKYDEAALRGGVDTFLAKYGNVRPLIVDLGNEPGRSGAQVLANVAAYKTIYEEIKKVDPTIFVIGTSIGPDEDYFKAGFGKYCDAYDFHTYEDSGDIPKTFAAYRDLMQKYNAVRPIWSTEMGLNSQGMPRNVVANEMIKKFVLFFACGGANASWFDLLYPDADGTNGDSSSAAHDVFDSRFSLYAPKLTAVAYYDVVNAIANKKFVAQKTYPDGIRAFLFRNGDGNALQVLWKDQGRTDIAVPLAGVHAVTLVRIDGRHRALNADGTGITTTVSDDPIMLLYDGGAKTLPDTLGKPVISLANVPTALRGAPTAISVVRSKDAHGDVTVITPPFWKCSPIAGKMAVASAGATQSFSLSCPETSAVRDADYIVAIGPEADRRGELYVHTPVVDQIAVQIRPSPAGNGAPSGVRLLIKNNGSESAAVTWKLVLDQERSLSKGVFGVSTPTSASFTQTPSGQATVPGNSSFESTVPLSGTDPLKIYHVATQVSGPAGHNVSDNRYIGGMVRVPKAKGTITLDGVLDEADWRNAPSELLNTADQVQAIDAQAAPWKGVQDLSATMQYLWDDKYLYVGVNVTDDIAGKLQPDDMLWNGDGLQFLIDPARDSHDKPGKYDYAMGVGINGPRAWCHSSGDPSVPTGAATDIVVSAKRKGDGTGAITYEVAIPWARLAPFKPMAGADLGLSMALNEDDGNGRHSFMTWFGDVQAKSLDTVGDLILSN